MRTFQTTKPQPKFLFVEATELQNTSEKSPTTFSEHFSWELFFPYKILLSKLSRKGSLDFLVWSKIFQKTLLQCYVHHILPQL